ncbi:MAG: hypothetical protein PHE86_01110 [Candidatus Marinimicrobia bacterium]|nr:hypothetical protein [Candidatus Neomarinimicrobiota bacterium]MDD5581606.1 hypothetical protein [Candidatus Neomarinimicrobiota bacterium]
MKKGCFIIACFVFLSFSSLQADPLIFEKPPFPDNDNVGLRLRNSQETAAFLNLKKLQMKHSFSMSVGSSGIGSESVISYHNQFIYPVNAHLMFYGDLILAQQAYASNPIMERLGNNFNSIYYNANMEYMFSDKTKLVLGISNIPTYFYYPWGINPYTTSRIYNLWP